MTTRVVGQVGERCWLDTDWSPGTCVGIDGRSVVVELEGGEHVRRPYTSVIPHEAVQEMTATYVRYAPYRWEGMPQGAWSCDYVGVNR
jgi:hypothetical protein